MQGLYQKIIPVPFTQVRLEDKFWAPRQKINAQNTLKQNIKKCKEAGRLDNFYKAMGRKKGKFEGWYFNDSDIYKVIEGWSNVLALNPNKKLEKQLDEWISIIKDVQQPDGYIDNYILLNEPENRFKKLKDLHELYCGGHLIEAAVAHFKSTRKKNLLELACKFADYIDTVFGEGKRHDVDGHEEIELALIKLYRVTGVERYLKLAEFFVGERGRECGRTKWGEYFQDHAPLEEQKEVTGHAVRAMYFYCGGADVYQFTGKQEYLSALNRLWEDAVLKKMYITGGVGAKHEGEAFGAPYELPSETAYAELCAAIGFVFWNHRMNQLKPDIRYIDVLERALYNGVLGGVSLDGKKFYYVNPLLSKGQHHRQEWYECACCPPNILRLIASLGEYFYATGDEEVYVNLYASNTVKIRLGETNIGIQQRTLYPWEGGISLRVTPVKHIKFTLYLRIPGWCPQYTIKINGKKMNQLDIVNGYLKVNRVWKPGDRVDLNLVMEIDRVYSHPGVKETVGKVVLQRGPIVYCLEAVDNGGRVFDIVLPADTRLKYQFRPKLLNGVGVIQGKALRVKPVDWSRHLYLSQKEITGNVQFTAIPYYAWDNRKAGEMAVWIAESVNSLKTPSVTA